MTRDEILERIALALERGVDQMDEQMDRSRQMRDENVRRHEQERDADLAAIQATNEHLMGQIEAMKESQARLVALYETNTQASSERLPALNAAAPDLLAVLKEYVEWFGAVHGQECPSDDTCSCIGGGLNERVNAAIAKAEGIERTAVSAV